jgi:hypothetical protein
MNPSSVRKPEDIRYRIRPLEKKSPSDEDAFTKKIVQAVISFPLKAI